MSQRAVWYSKYKIAILAHVLFNNTSKILKLVASERKRTVSALTWSANCPSRVEKAFTKLWGAKCLTILYNLAWHQF